MKILYVGINYRYINPTPILLPAALARCSDLHFYGPGYVSPALLAKGIDSYVDQVGGVDLLVVSKDLVGHFPAEAMNAYLAQFCRKSDGCFVSEETLQDIKCYLKANRSKVVISLLDVDVYASFQGDLDSYMTHGSHFIGPEAGCCDFSSPLVERERYIAAKKKKNIRFGLYEQFCRNNYTAMISLIHFVAEDEFCWKPIALRRVDASVPGTLYYRRLDIYKHLRRLSGKHLKVSRKSYEYPFKILNRLGLKPFLNTYVSYLYNRIFQEQLFDSRVCVTDGGLINFTIRKFFEIPAAGSLLVAWPTTNFTALGFKGGDNCIVAENNHHVVEVLHAVVKEPEHYQQIASAGQRMVMKQHSLGARAAQLGGAFERILSGKFRGSLWHEGNFKYLE